MSAVAVRSGQFYWNGYRLSYTVYGERGIPCLLVHGILLDSEVNRELAQRLAGEGCQVALLDLLGHGRSEASADPAEHRIDFYAEQMLAALDHLRWPRALVGGLSLGAISALQMAVRAPDRVLGLFVEMPVMEQSTPSAALMLLPVMLATRYTSRLYRPFARWLRRLPRPRSGWLSSVINAASAEPEVISAILHGVFVGPVVPPLAQRKLIAAPTLVIGHGGDWLHELRDAEALAQQIPAARLLRARSIIELRTRPERLWPEIATFVHGLRAPAVASRPADPARAAPPRRGATGKAVKPKPAVRKSTAKKAPAAKAASRNTPVVKKSAASLSASASPSRSRNRKSS